MLRQLQNSFRRSRERSMERSFSRHLSNGKSNGLNGHVTCNGITDHNGEMIQHNNPMQGDSNGREAVTSPVDGVTLQNQVAPPSPKPLSRSPSLRKKGVWQPGQPRESVATKSAEYEGIPDDAPLDIKEPVWTPKSSPTAGRKQYRQIKYDTNSLERKKTKDSQTPPPPSAAESYAWRGPDVPERSSSIHVRSCSLPRPESATVTLLREARRGHLPKGAQYLPQQPALYANRDGRPLRPPPVKEVDGVGPTLQGGMPVSLRSTVKGENQQDWYRRVYHNLHRQPEARSSYGLGGYSSEPELSYDDYIDNSLFSKTAVERYRGQPGRIEDYSPGQSSLAEQEAAKFLDNHAHIPAKRQLRAAKSAGPAVSASQRDPFLQRALEGYESDSTLVYHRTAPPDLTSREQKTYYSQIQRGGEVPLTGLRKRPPEKPTVTSSPRYQEAAVNIHYRSPVRWEELAPLSEQELQARQEENMRRVYEEARRRKEEKMREDVQSRRHGDNFTPSQKSPIPLDRYEKLFDDVADSPTPMLTATVLHEFHAQNNRELSLSRGESVKVRRKVDTNWYEGQKGTRIGIFPVSYVRLNEPRADGVVERWTPRPQVRAKHRFTAHTQLELPLSKGDIVSVIRRVDDNWYEGRRGDVIGIFPISYVEPLSADVQRENSLLRVKPVGSPAAHGLVMDGAALRSPGDELSGLSVDTKLQPVPYRAQYSYRPQNEDELDLQEGDIIHVLEQCPDGWYVGTNTRTGMFGTFPGNYTVKA